MGFLSGLFKGSGTVEGSVSLQNKPEGRQILYLVVGFFPVEGGAAKVPHTLPVAGKILDSAPYAEVKDGRFNVSLAPGWYHPLATWTRYVIEGKKMILDNPNPDQAWGLPKPFEVKKGESRHLNLKPDFNEFLRAARGE